MPLPYVEEEFKIDLTWKDSVAKDDLPPYVHIRRSILYSFSSVISSHFSLLSP